MGMPILSDAQRSRFWSNIRTGPIDQCWLWTKSTSRGYGQFRVSIKGKVHGAKSHRMAYFLFFGDLGALLVCHKCDVRACCNPNHLFLATSDENMKDMLRKGRSATGDRNGSRTHPESRTWKWNTKPAKQGDTRKKLSYDDAESIRRQELMGVPRSEMCKQFGITRTSVSRIVNNIQWKV